MSWEGKHAHLPRSSVPFCTLPFDSNNCSQKSLPADTAIRFIQVCPALPFTPGHAPSCCFASFLLVSGIFIVFNVFLPIEIKPQIPVDKCPCSYKFGRVMAFQACSQVSSLGVISDLKAWWQGFQGSSKSQAGMIRLLCAAMTQGWAHPQLAGPAEGGPAHRRGS